MKLIHRTPFSTSFLHAKRRVRNAAFATNISASHLVPAVALIGQESQVQVARGRRTTSQLQAIASAASTPSSSGQPVVVTLPASQQEAVEIAVQCLLPVLEPLLASKPAKAAKGFSSGSRPGSAPASNRFVVEIPVADPSPQAALDLTSLLLTTTNAALCAKKANNNNKRQQQQQPQQQLPQQLRNTCTALPNQHYWTVVHAREDALTLARTKQQQSYGQVYGLREACRQPQLGGVLLLLEPATSDVALLEQLLDEVWCGPAAVLLNPEWGRQGGAQLPPDFQALGDSLEVRYSFLPCAIQGLLGRKEGAVLLAADSAPKPPSASSSSASSASAPSASASAPARPGAPWRILLRQRDEYVQVGSMSRRPSSSDLELAFLNAAAAASPLTQTAKFIRGLLPGKK